MNLEEKLNDLFVKWGYRKFKMSKFEEYDLYAQNKDFLKSSQLITFTDLDGSLLALKPDITLSIIKNNAGEDDKVYYNENVYRPKDHHYREIPQAGIECIGKIDLYSEAEVIALAAKSLECVSKDYVLRISDVGFLQSFMDAEEIPYNVQTEIVYNVSQKNNHAIKALVNADKISEEVCEKILSLIGIYELLPDGIAKAMEIAETEDEKDILIHLSALNDVLTAFGVQDHIYLDFSIVNSMDYYNGVIFQGAVVDIPFTILSGGRYDRLPEKMGKKIDAIGFAVYMDIVENSVPMKKNYDADVLLTYGEDDKPEDLAAVMCAYKNKGIRVRAVRANALLREGGSKRYGRIVNVEEAKEECKND